MNNIVPVYQQFVNELGVELVVDTTNGLAYATGSGLGRIFEGKVSRSTLLRRLAEENPCSSYSVINAEIPTSQGLRTGSLYPASVVFKLALEFDPALAVQMGNAGANVYLLGLSGYKMKMEGSETPQTFAQALRLAADQAEQLEAQGVKILQQAEVIDELFTHSSIIRMAKLNCHEESDYKWQTLKKASEVLRLEIKKAPCPRYGTKNLYPHAAWSLAYPEASLPTAA